MLDSTTIKQMLHNASGKRRHKTGMYNKSSGAKSNSGKEQRVEFLKGKIEDTNYVDQAIKKIANDLAREFY